MKHLFVARHGEYSGISKRLNDEGIIQMEMLGQSIKEVLNGGTAYIISSTAPRALDSSEVLQVQLDLTGFEMIPYLWTGGELVSGFTGFSPYFYEKEFGEEKLFPSPDKGEAIYFDNEGNYQLLP